MAERNSVAELEIILSGKGFTFAKNYDVNKGICKVTATQRLSGTVIVAANTSRAPLWLAYRRALEFIVEQVNEYTKQTKKELV